MTQAASTFRFKRGDHVCIFYHDEEALLQTLVPYLAEGLNNGERCFCAQRKEFIPVLLKRLQSRGTDVASALREKALEIHTVEDLYFPRGKFEPKPLMGLLEAAIENAVKEGFSGFRTAGELSWAASGICDCDQLVGYEEMVEACFPGKPVIGTCQYKMSEFAPEVLQRVLGSHRLALTQTMAGSNHSALQVRYGKYYADIVADRLNPESTFYYVIQQAGDKDVLSWGATRSLMTAMSESEQAVLHLRSV